MNKKTIQHLDNMLAALKTGVRTAGDLAFVLNLSKRQVYRLLELGINSGLISRPVSGVYLPADSKNISFESYLSNVSVKMSQNDIHNKTVHNGSDDFGFLNITKATEKATETLLCHRDVRDTVTFICDIANLSASELEIRRAEKILRDSNLQALLTNDEVIQEYTFESIRRMVERLDADPGVVQVNVVAYFFGIFRNVVRADARAWYKQWKVMLKQGADLEVAVGSDERTYNTSRAPSETQQRANVAEVQFADDVENERESQQDYEIPEEWTDVSLALGDLVANYSLRRSAVHETAVRHLVHELKSLCIRPVDVQCALDDVLQYDPRATEYIVRLVKSGLVEETIVQLEKHYARSKTRVDSPIATKTRENTKNVPDDRYANFYELFPELLYNTRKSHDTSGETC